jgi:hypothetical protein
MKNIWSLFAFVLVLAVPALVLAQPDVGQPPEELGKHVGAVIDAVRSGSAIAIAAALIMLLVELFKAPWLGSVFNKVPKRWRIAIPIMLSGIAGMLSNIIGGIPWQEAVVVGLFAGPTAVFAHEAVVEAILGHARSRAPNLVS